MEEFIPLDAERWKEHAAGWLLPIATSQPEASAARGISCGLPWLTLP